VPSVIHICFISHKSRSWLDTSATGAAQGARVSVHVSAARSVFVCGLICDMSYSCPA
ncbi:unnamed protein product, partial [Candidula unifasciata]